MGFAALAFDGGRFYAERRFLQNAADAAALACAQRLAAGGSTTDAESFGRTLLTSHNLTGDPNATGVTVASTPVYTTWFNVINGDKRNLADGVVASGTDCRVALRAKLRMYFIAIVNPGLAELEVPANAHAITGGGMMPIVVNRYDSPPGPSGPPFTAGSGFHDYTKQAASDDVCNVANPSYCPDATVGTPGRERVLIGSGYTASDSDFRGFIALDIRDFSTVDGSGNPIHKYYNRADTMSANTLKDQEAAYVKDGYLTGQELPPYNPSANPPQPGLEVATMSGSSTGIIVSELKRWYKPGERDRILVQVFDGQVKEIPDFTLAPLASINANSPSGAPADGPTFKVDANKRFRDENKVVDVEMVRDAFVAPGGTASSDTPTQLQDFTFDPDNFTPGPPGTNTTIKNLQVTGGLADGIYTVIIKGTGFESPHPGSGAQLATHRMWVPLNIGGVTRDFQMVFPATSVDVSGGGTGTFTFQLSTGAGSQAWGGTAVSFGIDRGTCGAGESQLVHSDGTTRCVTATINPASATPDKNNPPTVTISVPSTGLPNGVYEFIFRGRGTNGNTPTGQPVVHVQPLQLNVGTTAGGARKYVSVQGYTVFQVVTCTVANDNNAVCGRAVTGMVPNLGDIAMGRRARLIPWPDAPY